MFKNSNIFFSKIFDMELIFAQEDNPQNKISIKISRNNIIKSPILYMQYRENHENTSYNLNYECEDKDLVKAIFGEPNDSYGNIIQVNDNNKDFLLKLNESLNIKRVASAIEDYDKDIDFFESDKYQEYKNIQNLLHLQTDRDFQELSEYIDTLNEMKISQNLLSFRNRMDILKNTVSLRSHHLFKNKISHELNAEIQKFQDEIDSINKTMSNGRVIYNSIIDIIRFDEQEQLQQEINKTESFDYNKEYDFDYDFTNLLPKRAKIWELVVFFNAIKCFRYLIADHIKKFDLSKNPAKKLFERLPRYSFASGNLAMIEYCNQNNLFDKNWYTEYFDIAIAYQNNFLFDYLIETLMIKKFSENIVKMIGISNNFSILEEMVKEFHIDLKNAIFEAFDSENFDLLEFLIPLRASDVNRRYNVFLFIFYGIYFFVSNVRIIHRAVIEERIEIVRALVKLDCIKLNVHRDGIFFYRNI